MLAKLDNADEASLVMEKWNPKGGQKSLRYWGGLNPISCHGNKIVKLILWSTLGRYLRQVNNIFLLEQTSCSYALNNIAQIRK